MDNVKKVLFVSRCLGKGGAERVSSELANYFSEHGVATAVVVFEEDSAYALNSQVKLYAIKSSNNKVLRIFRRVSGLKKVISQFKPDHIVCLGEFAKYVKAAQPHKIIDTTFSLRNYPGSVELRHRIPRQTRLYRYADKVVFQTKEIRDCFPPDIAQKSNIIPNAITTHLPVREFSDKSTIVTFCRLEPQKNLGMLISGFKTFSENPSHSKYCLKIFGDGSLRSALLEKVRSLNLEDRIFIQPFEKDIHEKIKNAAMFVTTSDYEGVQNALLEAMAMGIPCIATDCLGGGAKLLTKAGRWGLLVKRGDVAALAEAMSIVADDENFSKSLSEQAKAVNREYSSNIINHLWYEYVLR